MPLLSEWQRLSLGVRRPIVRSALPPPAIWATMLVTSNTTQLRAEQVPGGYPCAPENESSCLFQLGWLLQSVDELMRPVHHSSTVSALQAGAYVSNALNFALWIVLWATFDVSIWKNERYVTPLQGSP